MPAAATGTLAWARRTGGTLSRREQLDQIRRGAVARIARLASGLNPRGGRDAERIARLELPEREPDGALARAALECSQESYSPVLLGHCLRTWLFASLFGARDRVGYDEELLYVVCLLHDLGVTRSHAFRDERASCFAVEGAFAAERLALDNGCEAARAERVAEAISLHLNVDVSLDHGAEAHLLHAGAALEAVGGRAGGLGPAPLAGVLERHPRGDFVGEVTEALIGQVAQRPRSRIALLWRLGFRGLVEANPLDR